MKLYHSLQMDPNGLKNQISKSEEPRDKVHYFIAMFLRAVLIVAFSIALIAPISALFGPENNALGVALICMILSIRFVDFGYCIKDSMINMAVVFFLLWVAPVVAADVQPVLSLLVHFLAFFLILLMTSEQPEMGNGGLYAFAYIFLAGNPVHGDLFFKRGLLALCGYLVCGIILYRKHRDKHKDVRFRDLMSEFNLEEKKCQWQLQFALGVSIFLALGSLLKMERVMWGGFACASLLGCYASTTDAEVLKTKERLDHRIIGAVTGSVLFAVIYTVIPEKLHFLFGPVGGICLGFCTDYRWKTALNCLGALLLASGLYGMQDSVILRITNNLVGAAFGYLFYMLYQRIVERKYPARKEA